MAETAHRHMVRTTPETTTPRGKWRALLLAGAAAAVLAGCQVSELSTAAHLAPVPGPLERKISRMNMRVASPILVRIYKEESELEVWKQTRSGKYALLKTYEICAWSGRLGPKLKEGDRQAPEGFYTVNRGQMNPNSSYHLAFNIGFPNRFDRSHGRTGSHLMVHGDCSSRGCYAMEDDQIEEIYALAREAFRGGQTAFHVHAFPFRMTPENMARHSDSEHIAFWEMLKTGSDHFEVTKQPPKVDVCGQRYVFNANGGRFDARQACPEFEVDPRVEQLVADKREADREKRETVIAKVERSEERRKRWEDREAAVAAFFEAGRQPEAGADAQRTALNAVPDGTPDGDKPVFVDDAPAGLRMGLFKQDADDAAAATPVASIAGVDAAPPEATPAPIPALAPTVADGSDAAPAETTVAVEPDAPAAPSDKRGFFGSVKDGSAGLLRRAGSLFN